MKKRKIATLTLPLHNNYGGLLQAFALQKMINSLGHDTLLINNDVRQYPNWRKRVDLARQYLRRAIKGTPIVQHDFTSNKNKTLIAQHTSSFVKKYIQKTHLVKNIFGYKDIQKYGFDGYVVGSDQVWRTAYTGSIANNFYEFLEEMPNVKKVSYAASFGVDTWEFTQEETARCRSLANNFNAISVREDSGVTLCKKFLDVDAVKVLDPTLLIPKEIYIELVEKANLLKPKGKLFSYILDRSEANKQMEQQASQYLNTDMFEVMPRKDMKNLNSKNIEEFVYPPVEQWINGFIAAEYVLTDSFHGTVFAIIFKKNFIAIGNARRGLSRFTSILNQLGLADRLILDAKQFNQDKLKEKIDWNAVHEKLDFEKQKSKKFLKDNL